ncbi:MAG: hypothetical protein WCI93_02135 [bacterium]
MSDIIMHNIRISYDESHERVRNFVKYLQGENQTEELRAYYEETKRNQDNKIHLNDKLGNEFTLERTGEHVCELRLRGM